MVSGPGVVFFVSLIAEISSSYEKAWLSRMSFGRVCDTVTVCAASFAFLMVG